MYHDVTYIMRRCMNYTYSCMPSFPLYVHLVGRHHLASSCVIQMYICFSGPDLCLVGAQPQQAAC